ncbi:AI-2E family transporter [Pelagibaculum spongiae]|uniref:AI-2E family transporter n=1 Tax=Pelagibaculum spongiae TaxID=2080658 RepID=A0A2V1GUA5_9GAMM|nr:AI-2E family transporter [Pelagibaculum spongiae]PVZ69666.1 AI-2E family transporter [Pelagibaculum spongiae]
MVNMFASWYKRWSSNPQTVSLIMILLMSFAAFLFLGRYLTPIFAALIMAYVLDWTISRMHKAGVAKNVALTIAFSTFLGGMVLLVAVLTPLLWRQVSALISELPNMLNNAQTSIIELMQQYHMVMSPADIEKVSQLITEKAASYGQVLVSTSLSSISDLLTLVVYLVLLPVIVFFMLKDKKLLMEWFVSFMPSHHELAEQVWEEMNDQIGNYIRGKVAEILIVGGASYVVFALMGLNYALLLAVLVGFSVLIPYIGATVVTLPVLLVAFFQWGLSTDFYWLTTAYLIIQALDGNLLVPLLFSEAVNLHPIAIIAAVLIFGGVWGFWGVFFAIPLATLVKAIMNAWPSAKEVGSVERD